LRELLLLERFSLHPFTSFHDGGIAVQKAELKRLLEKALSDAGAKAVDQTPSGQSEYLDYEIRHPDLPGGKLPARFFLWELTQDRSVAGRPPGEHKLQLTLGDRGKGRQNFPSAKGHENFLLGYSQDYNLLVGFQIELHANFPWSKLVACRDEALTRAAADGWATHLRGRSPSTGQQELAIAFQPHRIVDWLRFQLTHPNVYGPARQAAAQTWPVEGTPAPTPGVAPVEEITAATVPPATPEDVAKDDEAVSAIVGDIQIIAATQTATAQVNIADRIAATNRHNDLVRKVNNRAHEVLGANAFVIDRDLPGHRRTYAGAALQPDLGLRLTQEDGEGYVVVEAKSLPVEPAGQWRQVLVGLGELARYSMVYNERFNRWPVRVLALERLPDDQDLQRFLRNLHDNEDIAVVWPEGNGFRTFSSHHEAIAWLAAPVD
jgi:hypothetical protein